eukprot:15665-Eustigmatos_ZCMA.PRE.1
MQRVTTLSQLVQLRRSGAVSDGRMALQLEDFKIFHREHGLYMGELQRLESLREGDSVRGGDEGNGA